MALKQESKIHKAIVTPPEAVVKVLPPTLLIGGLLLVILFRMFKMDGVLFEDADQFMSAIVSLGLFFGGMWVLLSKGYPPASSKYAVGAILLVAFHYMSDTVEPFLEMVKRLVGGAG